MSDTTLAPVSTTAPIPVGQVVPWAVFAGLTLILALYFMGVSQTAHEYVHDARHLLGFPCH